MNISQNNEVKELSLWIARDDSVIPDDMEHYIEMHPEEEIRFAKLHIFYDTPILEYNYDWYNGKPRYSWKNARIMTEVPSYMFPEIKMQTCVKFTGNIVFPNL